MIPVWQTIGILNERRRRGLSPGSPLARVMGVDLAKGEDYSVITIPDGVECEHRGCKNHISHPCEGCGRKGAVGVAYIRII